MESQDIARIDLTLVEEGGRRMESTPNGIGIGALRLRKWQIDHIESPEDVFDGYDTYLIRINYDLELEVDSPRVTWFELAVDFRSENGAGEATVIDALPRFGTFSETPKSYVLNRYLNFVPFEDGVSAHALLPASSERVDTFGIGGQRLRWRHVSLDGTGVREGSYSAWVVLHVPTGQVDQRVMFSARYDLIVDPEVEYRPTQVPAEFTLKLIASSDRPETATHLSSAAFELQDDEYHPSVFICYAHDTPLHKTRARQFGNLLVKNGIDTHMDQWDEIHRKPWDFWAYEHINKVDFIIVLASPICRKAFNGELKGTDNRGIRSEARLILDQLHTERDKWTPKVLPVVLPHEFVENVSEMLQPWTTDHYKINQLTREGIAQLLRAMTGVPRYSRPPLGKLPPIARKTSTDDGS
ncbi:hypothetical protein GCM10009566_00030 [Streptomyces murinus]